MPADVLDQRHDRIEHVAAVAILAHLAVDAQANADIGRIGELVGVDERRQHEGAVEGLGQLPGQALFLQLRLHVAQGQVQGRGVAGNGVQHFLAIRVARQRLADQHGDFRLVVHRAAILGNAETAFAGHHAGARLDEQQRLGRDRVVQLFRMLGVVAADADHLAQREVDEGAVAVMVLVTHQRLL
ncbi:hypothetical protein D9M71_548020 [compost metagenome]